MSAPWLSCGSVLGVIFYYASLVCSPEEGHSKHSNLPECSTNVMLKDLIDSRQWLSEMTAESIHFYLDVRRFIRC